MRLSHIHFGKDPSTKAKKLFSRMKEDEQVTGAVFGTHYAPGRTKPELKALTLWIRPHLFVLRIRK